MWQQIWINKLLFKFVATFLYATERFRPQHPLIFISKKTKANEKLPTENVFWWETANWEYTHSHAALLPAPTIQCLDYQDYQDPSVDSTVTDGHRQGEKSLKLINTPSHSPNDGQASPCLNSHSTHIPILIACSILRYAFHFLITVLYMHPIHRFPISPSVLGKSGYMLSLKLFDAVLMKTTQIHSSLQTPTPNLTPPLQILPLNIPIIPMDCIQIPSQFILS